MLDGLRGVAAAAVIALHNEPWIAPIPIRSGYLAVDLFFLMSGFVIASAYDRRFEAGMGATTFLRLRLVRLYPLYILAVGFVTVATLLDVLGFRLADWSRLGFLETVAAAALLLPAPGVRAVLYPLNPMAWSLFFELVFNAVHAAGFHLLRGRGLRLAIAASGIMLLAGIAAMGSVDYGLEWHTCWMAVPRTGFSFFLGVAMCRRHREGRLIRPRIPAPFLLLAILVVLMVGPERAHRLPWDAAMVFLFFPFLLCAAVATEPGRPRLYTILGEASYPAYILQVPCLVAIGWAYHVAGRDAGLWRPWSGLTATATVLLVGWLAGVGFDPWARRRLGALLSPSPRGDG